MRIRTLVLATAWMLADAGMVSGQTAGSGFTYQGTFADAGAPANGNYDFQFALYAAASGGSAAQTVSQGSVAVSGGLINTLIDFGAAVFDGQGKWVEVRVRPAGSAEAYTVLSPRQALTAVPYALGLPMPFQRTVATGAQPSFKITSADGGTAIAGTVSEASGFAAILGTAASGVGVEGDTASGIGVNGVATQEEGTGVRGKGGPGSPGISFGGDGVRGLGGIGVHGVGGLYGGWFQSDHTGIRVDGFTGGNTMFVPIAQIINHGDGDLIQAGLDVGGEFVTKFRVDGTGEVFADGGFSADGADVAEYVPSTEALETGDVVEIDADHGQALRRSSQPNSTTVAGVVSTKPGLTLNGSMSGQDAQKNMPRLALGGRVPVKTTSENGAIHAGDLLVSSSRPGRAMRAPKNPQPGTVIGKAMQSLDADSGEIEMLVMLR